MSLLLHVIEIIRENRFGLFVHDPISYSDTRLE